MYCECDLSSAPPPTPVCHSKLDEDISQVSFITTKRQVKFCFYPFLSATVKMESGQGGLGWQLLVEPPSWRKSTGQLWKLLWSDHSPLLLLDCWKNNASFIKHSHRLNGARGWRVGSRRGPAGASRRDHSFSLLSVTPQRLMVRCMYHCSELILV